MAQNAIYNKALNAYNVPRDVYHAIKNAAAKTGVNFTYLMEKAAVESSFDKNAKARTSSATGLYQFIESTWLKMVKDHVDKHGLGKFAAKIDDQGRVSDSRTRAEILNLRKNPEIASLMAAEFDSQNYARLKQNVGGEIGSTELYMAHFLGAGGASSFLNAMKKSPNMVAADIFPKEARANRNVFYDARTGTPRTLSQVHAFFDRKFQTSLSGDDIMTAGLQQNAAPTNFAAHAPENTGTPAGLRTHNNEAVRVEEDPFTRLAALINGGNIIRANNFSATQNTDSLLRLSDSARDENRNGWQILPPSHYGRLSLSPAQLMMLSDWA